MTFAICFLFFFAIIMPGWLMHKHCQNIDNDPEYRRRARERGW